MIPVVKAKLLEGKKGLIVGIANENSIAWGCAKAFRAFGAESRGDLSQRQGQEIRRAARPRARSRDHDAARRARARPDGSSLRTHCQGVAQTRFCCALHRFLTERRAAGTCRRCVARGLSLTTMDVSCWTFIRMAHLAEALMRKGGTLFRMTYYGSQTVVKNYNIMGVAKAALESAVRYLAAELGPKGIRVHAISPGPLATRAASGIPEFDALLDKAKAKAPSRSLVSIEDVGVATTFLAHAAARLITGETLYIDGGYPHHRLE